MKAFSLAEVVASLTIAACVLVVVLTIYSQAERSSAAVTRTLDNSQLPSEVLQRIAQDLDEIVTSGDAKITIDNKYDPRGYSTARMEILNSLYEGDNDAKTFKRIVWQTSRDYDSDANGLVLYRSYSGIGVEDKLLDENKADWEKELFVPICSGVTFFRIQVPRGKSLLDKWKDSSLPGGVVVTISFAEPFETPNRTLDVLEEEKIKRTIAVDRTRKIRLIFLPRNYYEDDYTHTIEESNEPNDVSKDDTAEKEQKQKGQTPEDIGKPDDTGKTRPPR